VRLVDKGIVGSRHVDDGLEALNKDVLLLASMSSSSRGLRNRRGCMSMSRRDMCTKTRSSNRRRRGM
jgi:hypothetical protein